MPKSGIAPIEGSTQHKAALRGSNITGEENENNLLLLEKVGALFHFKFPSGNFSKNSERRLGCHSTQ
jgi:hypothetical protein